MIKRSRVEQRWLWRSLPDFAEPVNAESCAGAPRRMNDVFSRATLRTERPTDPGGLRIAPVSAYAVACLKLRSRELL